jgi:hypothetical protein
MNGRSAGWVDEDGDPPQPLGDRAGRVGVQALCVSAGENLGRTGQDSSVARPGRHLRRVATARADLPQRPGYRSSLPGWVPFEHALTAEDDGNHLPWDEHDSGTVVGCGDGYVAGVAGSDRAVARRRRGPRGESAGSWCARHCHRDRGPRLRRLR